MPKRQIASFGPFFRGGRGDDRLLANSYDGLPNSLATLKILHYSAPIVSFLANVMLNRTNEGEILTIKEVAAYLKVTERTIYRLAAEKKIPAFKIGGTWRFPRSEIDQWIRQQTSSALMNDEGINGQE